MAFGFAQPASGLIADRFLPPDRGHRFLIDFARAYADEITVVVCGHPSDPIAAPTRVARLREQFPDVIVRQISAEGPGAPEGDRIPFDHWLDSWLELIARSSGSQRFDLLFGMDSGDRHLAARIGAQFVPCFPDPALLRADDSPIPRSAFPGTSSTPARRTLKKVCLFGPESTGKSTLARQLAKHYQTVHVQEYSRGYLDAIGSVGTADDVPWIARGQRASEIASAEQASRVLICDTNLVTVALWSDVLFGATPGWVRDEAARLAYDLWLLTDIDIPFEADPQRCFPDPAQRAWFMHECATTLDRLGVVPVSLRGSPEARLSLARAAIDRLLG